MSIIKHVSHFFKDLVARLLDCITWDKWANRSWSQEGEDLLLFRILGHKSDGVYVDVGAHHPKRFSNTYLFYRKGWRGINIDAMPGSMKLFEKYRPQDINVETGVGSTPGMFDYFIFNEPALSGFSKKLSQQRSNENNDYYINEIIKVQVLTLADILNKYHRNNKIDFLSVDVEGLDLDVLRSNDWVKYRPYYALVEILDSSLHQLDNHEITCYMKTCGYEIYAKQINTVVFRDQQAVMRSESL